MSGTDPLSGARFPTTTNAVSVPQDIQNAVNDLSDNLYAGPFASTSARDTAFSAWVAAGNTMRDGLHAFVTGVGDQFYLGGAWHPTWQAFNPATGTRMTSYSSAPFGTGPGSQTWGYRLEGQRVWCRGWGFSSAGASVANALITAVPSLYRPISAVTLTALLDGSPAAPVRLEIDNDGLIYTKYAIPANSYVNFDACSWPLG